MKSLDLHARDVTDEANARRRVERRKGALQFLAIGAIIAFSMAYLLT